MYIISHQNYHYEIFAGEVLLTSNFHCFFKSNKPTLSNMWLVHILKLASFRAYPFLSFHPHIGLLSIAHHHLRQWHKHVVSPRYLWRLLQCRTICATSLPSVSHEHPWPRFEVNASWCGVRTAPRGRGPRYPHNPPSTMLLTCLPSLQDSPSAFFILVDMLLSSLWGHCHHNASLSLSTHKAVAVVMAPWLPSSLVTTLIYVPYHEKWSMQPQVCLLSCCRYAQPTPLYFLHLRWCQQCGMLATSTTMDTVYAALLLHILKQCQCWWGCHTASTPPMLSNGWLSTCVDRWPFLLHCNMAAITVWAAHTTAIAYHWPPHFTVKGRW